MDQWVVDVYEGWVRGIGFFCLFFSVIERFLYLLKILGVLLKILLVRLFIWNSYPFRHVPLALRRHCHPISIVIFLLSSFYLVVFVFVCPCLYSSLSHTHTHEPTLYMLVRSYFSFFSFYRCYINQTAITTACFSIGGG